MHEAIEHNTKYYRLNPAQFVWLRRGSKWQPIFFKIVLCLGCLSALKYTVHAQSYEGHEDKSWLETFLIIITWYYLLTGSLYLVTYPLSEALQEVPVKISFLLMRIITAIIFISIVHLYYGISSEMDMQLDD